MGISNSISYANWYRTCEAGEPLIGIVAEIGGEAYYFGEIDYCDDDHNRLRHIKEGTEVRRFNPDATVRLYAVGIIVGNSEEEYLGEFPARNVAQKLEDFNLRVAQITKEAYENIKLLAAVEVDKEIAGFQVTKTPYFNLPDPSEIVKIANEVFR